MALLLSLSLVPVSNANGGVIDSVTVSGDGIVGEGPITVNISLVGVGGASSSSVNWSAVLSDLDGNVIDSDNGNRLVDDGVTTFVETMLGDAPLGLSNLTVSISGDIGTPGQDQWINYYSTIHRLRPLNISLGSPIFNSVDATGNDTGNLSLSDGDFVNIEIPVINNGDVDWNGTLNVSLDSLDLTHQSVNSSGDSAQIFSFLSGPVSEGIHNLNATLVGIMDQFEDDNELSSNFEVGPPPLPSLSLELERLNQPQPGSEISWRLSATNFGESSFNGQLVCNFGDLQIFSENATIAVSQTLNLTVTMISKPGSLVCSSDGVRTSETLDANDTVSMSSAIFIGAGHSSPSLLGGPWHAGDEITLSMLLRNEGDAIGSAEMQVEINGDIENGSISTLEGGKAGEVNHKFSFSTSGEHIVNWSVVSQYGAVDSNLSGSILIPVLSSQTLTIAIEETEILDTGVEISWSVDLSEGRDRTVIFNFGSINDGLKGPKIIEERNLLPGRTFGSMNIGFQQGQEIYASIATDGWTSGFGSYLEDESPMPDFTIEPQITVNPVTQPKVPAQGSQVTILYTLSNTGGGPTPQGQIVITDDDGNILASVASPSLESSSLDSSTTVKWPSGNSVKIIVNWHVDGVSVSDQVMITSEVIEADEEDFVIPWGGILGGLVAGMVLIFAIRLKNTPKSDKKVEKKKTKKKTSTDEKVEVACPSCDRRLRVPSTYSGGVRCPECETKFDVEGSQEEDSEEEEESSPEEPVEEKDLWAASDNDILGCPKCARNLKVPYDRRPAKARCPACETIFEARKS